MRHGTFGAILIAVDVGINDGCEADILELAGEFYRCEGSSLSPPFNDDMSAPRIDANDDRTGMGCSGGLDEMRVFHRRRCDDDSACASLHTTMPSLYRSDTAADLHRTAALVSSGDVRRPCLQPLCAKARRGVAALSKFTYRHIVQCGENRAKGLSCNQM